VLRPMVLEFPDDPAVPYLDRQYLLGDRLLVAPVFSAEGDVRYYLPPGAWTDLLSGRAVEGGRWVSETHDFTSAPVLVRPNTVLPLGAREDVPDYDWADGVTLLLASIADGAEITTVVPDAAGGVAAEFVTTRAGDTIRVRRTLGTAAWNVLLAGPVETATPIARPADADDCEIRLG